MTTVIATATRQFCVLVSDRVVTVTRRGRPASVHDSLSNKLVVFIGADAVAVLAYTGAAYLEGLPTDQWMAQTIWGAPIDPGDDGIIPMVGGKRPRCTNLNQTLFSLRAKLRTVNGGAQVEIAATGYRYRRKRFAPFLIAFDGSTGSGLTNASPLMRMQPPADQLGLEGIIGQIPTIATIHAARAEEPVPRLLNEAEHAAYVGRIHAATIRRIAELTPTVGHDVMKVMIPTSHHRSRGRGPWQRRIICEYEASRLGPEDVGGVGYCPWVVTDCGYQPASIIGNFGIIRNFRGWKVELSRARAGDQQGSQAIKSQFRPPMPR